MRFVHSLWTTPSLNERWYISPEIATLTNMWYYALSVAYLKNLNQEIVLYTDTFGKECLEHIPYNEIYTILDKKIPQEMCPIMWACAKFYALTEEELGSIHIDGDVFIKTQQCLDIISNSKCDLFVQGEEDANLANDTGMTGLYIQNHKYLSHLIFPKGLAKMGNKAYNTGILQFNKQELKDTFISSYFFMLDQVVNDKILIEKWEEDKNICPDLVIEQRFIYDLSKKYDVSCLIDYQQNNINNYANQIGFQHVLSQRKYYLLHSCKATLKHIDKELYNLTAEKEKYLKEKYFSN